MTWLAGYPGRLTETFVWDLSDQLWSSNAQEIQPRGPMAIVSAGVTAAESATWGAIKRLYR